MSVYRNKKVYDQNDKHNDRIYAEQHKQILVFEVITQCFEAYCHEVADVEDKTKKIIIPIFYSQFYPIYDSYDEIE